MSKSLYILFAILALTGLYRILFCDMSVFGIWFWGIVEIWFISVIFVYIYHQIFRKKYDSKLCGNAQCINNRTCERFAKFSREDLFRHKNKKRYCENYKLNT